MGIVERSIRRSARSTSPPRTKAGCSHHFSAPVSFHLRSRTVTQLTRKTARDRRLCQSPRARVQTVASISCRSPRFCRFRLATHLTVAPDVARPACWGLPSDCALVDGICFRSIRASQRPSPKRLRRFSQRVITIHAVSYEDAANSRASQARLRESVLRIPRRGFARSKPPQGTFDMSGAREPRLRRGPGATRESDLHNPRRRSMPFVRVLMSDFERQMARFHPE